MTGPALQPFPGLDRRPGRDPSAGGTGWLDWLRAHLDPVWRPGEWDGNAQLFTGDLHSDRAAAWPCRTPGCPTATRHHHGRCDGCRRARTGAGLSWEDFDADPPRHPIRPLLPPTAQGVAGSTEFRGACSGRAGKGRPVNSFHWRCRHQQLTLRAAGPGQRDRPTVHRPR
jgi:hypothetical protein